MSSGVKMGKRLILDVLQVILRCQVTCAGMHMLIASVLSGAAGRVTRAKHGVSISVVGSVFELSQI